METIKINCPECNQTMEYWTINSYIYCTKCKTTIEVKPCKEKIEEELVDNPVIETYNIVSFEDSLCEGCIHHSHYWDEVDGELYDDGCYCKNLEAQSPIDYHLRNCYSGIKGCPYFESTNE